MTVGATRPGRAAMAGDEDQEEQAKEAVIAAMYPDGSGPRSFRNLTQIVSGHKRS
jgi:hypothetical protein